MYIPILKSSKKQLRKTTPPKLKSEQTKSQRQKVPKSEIKILQLKKKSLNEPGNTYLI